MTARIEPNYGKSGRVTIDETRVTTARIGKYSTQITMQQRLEGDLCLAMCPGVRLIKGYMVSRAQINSGTFEVREDFQGWADVREHNSVHADTALHAFEISIDLDIQLPRSKRRLKLSSAAQYQWKKIGGYSDPTLTTFEPTFTYHTQELTPEMAKSLTEICHNSASNARHLIEQYATAIFDATVHSHFRTLQCDPKTGRASLIRKG
jgi:hypothetical protein